MEYQMSNTEIALIGFIAWALALLVLMEAIRTYLVIIGKIVANAFSPDNNNLSPFMQRLARAHANCIEGLPIFGGILAVAVMAGQDSDNGWAGPVVLRRPRDAIDNPFDFNKRRRSQRAIHGFRIQMAIGVYWLHA
jgi:uncharacterized MAPEG superfamily protein